MLQNPLLTRAVEQEYYRRCCSARWKKRRNKKNEIRERSRTKPSGYSPRGFARIATVSRRVTAWTVTVTFPRRLYLSTWHTKWGFTMASLRISLTDVSQSNRRKNAHLGGRSGEFLAAVLQSQHPRQNDHRYFVFRPSRIAVRGIVVKIRTSLRHAAEFDIRANPSIPRKPLQGTRTEPNGGKRLRIRSGASRFMIILLR